MHSVTITRGQDCRQEYAVAEPMTVRAWVNLHVGDEFPTPMLCLYQGQPLLRAQWNMTIIEADVLFVALPLGGGGGGGGKNPLAVIGMAVVMVAAIAAQQYWATGLMAAGWSAASAGAIAALGGAAIMIGGSLLINALFPTKLPGIDSNSRALESASPTYSFSASQNQARMFQMIPWSAGTNEQTPDLAAQPWVEFMGNEQYLHQLLCIGIGEYQIRRVSIEDTAVWENGSATGNFPEVEIEIVNPGQRITLFPDNIETAGEVSGQSLNHGTIGPFTANSAGTQASAIAIDIVLPQGLGRMNQQAGGAPIISHTVSVRFDYRRINDHGVPQGDFQTLFSTHYTNATRTAQRHTHITNVPAGRYQVRGVSTGGGHEDAYLMNEVVWAGMKAYLPSRLVYPDITMIAVRARATNSLSQGSMRQFRVVHTRKLPIWNPQTGWSAPTPTNSWAWAMAAIAKYEHGGRRTDRQIDLNALYRLAQELTARGDEFCQVLDTRQSVWGLFTDACRCVRAIPRALLSTISWMRDGPGRPVRGVFTPYNIVRGTFNVDYAFFSEDSPDDVFVEYRDREGWVERDVRAALPDSLSHEPARKRFMGITKRSQAWKEGCYEAACNAYRRIFLKWSTELEGRLLCRGDMVLVTHPLGGESTWASVTGWNADARTLLLDTTLQWEEFTDSFYAVLRRPNGMPYGPVRVASVGERSLTFDERSLAAVEATEAGKDRYVPIWEWLSDGAASAATAVIFGKEAPGVQAIILSVKPRPNGICDIEAVIEDERVHQADLGPVPPWTPGGEVNVITVRPVIANLVATFDFAVSLLTLSWTPAAAAVSYQVEFRSYDGDLGWSEWNDLGESFETTRAFTVPRVLVEYRVRGLGEEIAGLWATRQADCSVPMPGQVALSLAAPYNSGTLSLGWPAVSAHEIVLVLSSANSERMRATVPGNATSATITAEDMKNAGGPWREVSAVAISMNSTWEVRSPAVTALAPPPAKISGVNAVLLSPGTARVTWTHGGAGLTGYVIVHVDQRGESNLLTIRGDGTTHMDIPVPPGRNNFAVAATDVFYDVTQDIYSLFFSDPAFLEVSA